MSRAAIALASCLDVIERFQSDGDPAQIQVIQSWTTTSDEFCIIWSRPSFPGPLGYCSQVPAAGGIAGADHRGDPAAHGSDVAHFVVIEPLGTVADRLRPDAQGVSWIGRPPAV